MDDWVAGICLFGCLVCWLEPQISHFGRANSLARSMRYDDGIRYSPFVHP